MTSIRIEPYTEDLIPSVKDFNARLLEGGVDSQFPEQTNARWLLGTNNDLYEEHFIALENSTVRGAYTLKHRRFWLKENIEDVPDYRGPISEGRINSTYGAVGIQLLKDALRREPLLYGYGGSGRMQKFFQAMNWKRFPIPLFLKVLHPFKFLRNIEHLRQNRFIKLLFDLFAFSGLGWVFLKTIFMVWSKIRKKREVGSSTSVRKINKFPEETDRLWEKGKYRYSMVAVRDSTSLNALYPPKEEFIKLKISQGNKFIGWVVLLDSRLSSNRHYGDMRVASIIDCFSHVKNTSKVVKGAESFLRELGVDIIISRQTHNDWQNSFKAEGFIPVPTSNTFLAISNKLNSLLQPHDNYKDRIHITAVDGDGPKHNLYRGF